METGLNLVIIPDGNRRWARQEGLHDWEGHRSGYETFKNILRNVWDLGVTNFTFWALSYSNFAKRPAEEQKFFIVLTDQAIDELEEELGRSKRDIRFRTVGEWREKLPGGLTKKLEKLHKKTAQNRGQIFTLLLIYDGIWDVYTSINVIQQTCSFPLGMSVEIIDTMIHRYLPSGHIPMIDLCIRTGGEPHLSGGMLMWQMRDAHLYFTDTLWPNFTLAELESAITQFRTRERRFGA